jgi:hypothetical protein
MARTVTFLVAPDIPKPDLDELEANYKAVVANPELPLVVNFELRVDTVELRNNYRLLVVAPRVPVTDVADLRRRLMDPTDNIIAVGYEVAVNAIYLED